MTEGPGSYSSRSDRNLQQCFGAPDVRSYGHNVMQQPLALAAKRLASSRSSASCNSTGARSLLHPKSISRTSSDPSAARVSMMLLSLKSRWQYPRACTACKACCAALPCWSLGCCSASNVRPTTLQRSITSVHERTTATLQSRAGSAPGVVCQGYPVWHPRTTEARQMCIGLRWFGKGRFQAGAELPCLQTGECDRCKWASGSGWRLHDVPPLRSPHLGCPLEQHMRAALPSGMRQQ